MRVRQRKAHLCGRVALAMTMASVVAASGCARQQTETPATGRPHAVRAASAGGASRPDPQQAAIARIQAQPLYQAAQQACRAKRYAQAARLLEQLAQTTGLNGAQARGLNDQERAFMQQQRALCLQDAGLPAPAPYAARALPAAPPFVSVGAASPETADCGPRALLLLCQQEGIRASLPQLRQLAGTMQEGTSLAGLEKAAQSVGLKAEGVQVSREALPDVDMPAIAYVNGNHFIMVLSVQGRGEDATATVQDPNNAHTQTIPQERLLRLCSGYLLLAHR